MLGKIEGKKKRERQRIRWLDSITELNQHESEQTLGDSEGQGEPGVLQSMESQSLTELSN